MMFGVEVDILFPLATAPEACNKIGVKIKTGKEKRCNDCNSKKQISQKVNRNISSFKVDCKRENYNACDYECHASNPLSSSLMIHPSDKPRAPCQF